MAQINLKLTSDEYDLLQHYAKKENLPLASALRILINPSFNEWKIDYSVSEYCSGRLGFKKAWQYSALSFNQWLLALEKSECDFQMPELIELQSEKIAQEIDPRDFLKST